MVPQPDVKGRIAVVMAAVGVVVLVAPLLTGMNEVAVAAAAFGVLSVVGLILGVLGRRDARRGLVRSAGASTAAVVLGSLGTVLLLLYAEWLVFALLWIVGMTMLGNPHPAADIPAPW